MPFIQTANSHPKTRCDGSVTLIRQALRLRIPLAVAAMTFAGLGLVVNRLGPNVLGGFFDGAASTHPMTAYCLFALGYWVVRMKRFGHVSFGRNLVAGMVLMFCTARVMSAALSALAGAPPLAVFGPAGPFSGYFSVEAAMALGAFAAAALARRNHGRIGMAFLICGLGVVYNTVVEVAYGVTFFRGEVSLFTQLGLIAAAIAMLSVYVNRPFVRVSFLVGDLGSQTRMMAAAATVVPLLGGFVLHAIMPIGTNGFPAEAAMTSAVTWTLLVILFGSSARLESTAAWRRRVEREIAMQSRIDPLTKALNRFGMMETMEGAWLSHRSAGEMFGLILVDLDYFQRLNDTFGHDTADDALARVSATLLPQLRDTDAMGRWGQGEFMILLKIKEPSDLKIVVTRLRRAIENMESQFAAGLDGMPAQITASFGVSEILESDHGPSDAVSRADLALTWSKDARDKALDRQIERPTAHAAVA
ncbi:GGDEF domain-containing protein [Octadecabacter sp. 1_MG-2023]|uniref:GGDEF domain-containing protein n=1 Tax=unclassified Octadecabacter TaxID=196158 RepID=UPI001C08A859|nr:MULTISPECIES: GGDEF domain-containing protein [unclassified Octadecabacter]MBU2993618.1 GGDEF domain-containing protein [Octadecabacter sp. B2R22]MDO6735538.1 GGDEF domain-containing protein [Octadecabacter sp. 1_MG-2023]